MVGRCVCALREHLPARIHAPMRQTMSVEVNVMGPRDVELVIICGSVQALYRIHLHDKQSGLITAPHLGEFRALDPMLDRIAIHFNQAYTRFIAEHASRVPPQPQPVY